MSASGPTVPNAAPTKAWYREPMVWLVLAVPTSALLMGAIMLVLSITSYDGLVADDYYRRGLEINRVLERDQAAAAYGLAGELVVDEDRGRIQLELRAESVFTAPESVRLRLYHATRAGRDRETELVLAGALSYAGPRLELSPGRWYLEVQSDDWRLTGTLFAPHGRHAALRPQR